MARLWGALQSTITEAYKTANDLAQAKWKEITCTVIDEGETTERRLLDVNVMGDILEAFKDANGLVPGMVGYVGPFVVPLPLPRKETLTEVDLDTGKLTFSQTMNGIIIVNESSTNTLTYTINEIPITLAPGEDDEGYYDEFTEVTIAGTSPDFRAIGLGTL